VEPIPVGRKKEKKNTLEPVVEPVVEPVFGNIRKYSEIFGNRTKTRSNDMVLDPNTQE
jgi:hypothetical protein